MPPTRPTSAPSAYSRRPGPRRTTNATELRSARDEPPAGNRRTDPTSCTQSSRSTRPMRAPRSPSARRRARRHAPTEPARRAVGGLRPIPRPPAPSALVGTFAPPAPAPRRGPHPNASLCHRGTAGGWDGLKPANPTTSRTPSLRKRYSASGEAVNNPPSPTAGLRRGTGVPPLCPASRLQPPAEVRTTRSTRGPHRPTIPPGTKGVQQKPARRLALRTLPLPSRRMEPRQTDRRPACRPLPGSPPP